MAYEYCLQQKGKKKRRGQSNSSGGKEKTDLYFYKQPPCIRTWRAESCSWDDPVMATTACSIRSARVLSLGFLPSLAPQRPLSLATAKGGKGEPTGGKGEPTKDRPRKKGQSVSTGTQFHPPIFPSFKPPDAIVLYKHDWAC